MLWREKPCVTSFMLVASTESICINLSMALSKLIGHFTLLAVAASVSSFHFSDHSARHAVCKLRCWDMSVSAGNQEPKEEPPVELSKDMNSKLAERSSRLTIALASVDLSAADNLVSTCTSAVHFKSASKFWQPSSPGLWLKADRALGVTRWMPELNNGNLLLRKYTYVNAYSNTSRVYQIQLCWVASQLLEAKILEDCPKQVEGCPKQLEGCLKQLEGCPK